MGYFFWLEKRAGYVSIAGVKRRGFSIASRKVHAYSKYKAAQLEARRGSRENHFVVMMGTRRAAPRPRREAARYW